MLPFLMIENDAFCVVNDVKIKIEKLLKFRHLDSESRQVLESVYKQVDSLEETAKTTLPTNLQRAISSEVRKLRRVVAQMGPDDEKEEEEEVDQFGLEDLKQKIDAFNRQLKMREQICADGLYNSFPEEEEEEENPRDVGASKMIGMHDVYKEVRNKLMRKDYSHETIISLVGMPGIGKTTLAHNIFHDPVVMERFDHRVWVRVGKKHRLKDIPRLILAEIDPDSVLTLPGVEVEAVHEYLKVCLKSKSYLIVLDDVWDRYIAYLWHPVYRYAEYGLNHPFLHRDIVGSRILLTSRLQQGIDHTNPQILDGVVMMRLLNKKESWDLFRDRVFGNGIFCPPELVEAGILISEKCEGLPLTIVAVARLLSEEEKSTLEYWNEVAAKKNHRLFMDAYNGISKVLLPSYNYLPSLLRMCFLYIGLFRQNYEIPKSRLLNLWIADGFLELNENIHSFSDALGCLNELVSNSLVMVYKRSSISFCYFVKTCGLHSSLWHLSKQKSRETKFALIISNRDDILGDGMEGHHRLSIHSNALLGIKYVHKLVEDNCASTARSLLCFGPYHQYQVPLCFHLKLLRELDALSIRFYEFPMEVLHLIRLTYLALTTNGMIPTSICQLQFLEFFIVDRHQSIKSCKDASYLPMEIWSLQKLKHLQVMGSNLPDPHGASLDRLLTISKMSARSCTEVVLKGVPNLWELSIQIELAPGDGGKPLSCFAHISRLRQLNSFKCVIVNPEVVPKFVLLSSPPCKCLVKLSLSGLGYPWKEMRKIASLPSLTTLKLKKYAFQGQDWKVEKGGFVSLLSLVIEDTDLVNWQLGHGAFGCLMSISIKNCYRLKKVHGKIGRYLVKIEIVDCNPSCIEEMNNATVQALLSDLDVHSSWIEGN